jgi:hypothetical protein
MVWQLTSNLIEINHVVSKTKHTDSHREKYDLPVLSSLMHSVKDAVKINPPVANLFILYLSTICLTKL